MWAGVNRKLLIKTAILLGVSLVIFIVGYFPNFTLRYYSNGLYPIIAIALRWLSAWLPFAIGDVLYVLLIAFALLQVGKTVVRMRDKTWRKNNLFHLPFRLLNIGLILYISFKILWGLNYSRPSISTQLGIKDQKYKVEELVKLANFFINQLNTLEPQVNTTKPYTLNELRAMAVDSYHSYSLQNPFFTYRAPAVKSVLNNWIVTKVGIEGYYNPVSGEANINTKLVPWVLPFVTCHEIAHQIGVAREDEANLVAYLVGLHSKDPNLRYSVSYNMLRYILFEIRFKSPDDYLLLRDTINPRLLARLKAENLFWKQYNGKMSNYMGAAFDKFLKLNRQKRGIKSYQNIVVWLWNYHKKEIVVR